MGHGVILAMRWCNRAVKITKIWDSGSDSDSGEWSLDSGRLQTPSLICLHCIWWGFVNHPTSSTKSWNVSSRLRESRNLKRVDSLKKEETPTQTSENWAKESPPGTRTPGVLYSSIVKIRRVGRLGQVLVPARSSLIGGLVTNIIRLELYMRQVSEI